MSFFKKPKIEQPPPAPPPPAPPPPSEDLTNEEGKARAEAARRIIDERKRTGRLSLRNDLNASSGGSGIFIPS